MRENHEHTLSLSVSRPARRYFRYIFNTYKGKEWEADLWAWCAFIRIAKSFDCRRELAQFLHHHPEKVDCFCLAAIGTAYSRATIWISKRFA